MRKYVWGEGRRLYDEYTYSNSFIIETMKEWHYALAYEIKHWKTIGGSKISIMNGRFLYTDYENTVYVFQLISEVSLPEGSPIRIEFDGEEATGEVLSVHGLEIELKLNDYIQGEIREAVLYSERVATFRATARAIERST
ncbi:hypothetical protein HFP66_30125 [Bacillus sp. A17A.1]